MDSKEMKKFNWEDLVLGICAFIAIFFLAKSNGRGVDYWFATTQSLLLLIYLLSKGMKLEDKESGS